SLPLPARLGQAGDLPQVAQFAHGDPAHLQLAVEGPRTARHFAAVADARRGRVARQLSQLQTSVETLFQRQALVVGGRLEGSPLCGILRNQSLDGFVTVYGAFLSHCSLPFPLSSSRTGT